MYLLTGTEVLHIMSIEEYKNLIIQMLQKFDESDHLFMKQIYTLVKKHLERNGRL